MAIIDLTTVDRVKLRLLKSSSDTDHDAVLGELITSASGMIEQYLNRHVEQTTYTEELDVPSVSTRTVWLRAWPVSSITSVKNATGWDWANETALDTDLYHVQTDSGRLSFDTDLVAGQATLQVIYVGGMATNTAGVISAYPHVAEACDIQVAAMFKRMSTPLGVSETTPGATTRSEGALRLVPMAKELLATERRAPFGGL